MVRRYLPKSTEELIRWYERYISPLSLVAGFLADNLFLLRRVDLFRTNALLFAYLLVAALCIVLINAIESGKIKHKLLVAAAPFIPVVMQFCFGGLFSGYLSLYSRSASVALSWIFVLALAALLIGNERFRRLYVRLPFQIALYFLVLFSFLEFFLPVIFKQIGPLMFFAAGLLSIVLITAFMYVLQHLAKERYKESRTSIAVSIAAIFALFNLFYFTNVIPPLPLALKEAGVYHVVSRDGNGVYTLLGEQLPWYEEYLNYPSTFHKTPGDTVYAWSAVFAPSGLSTEILHQWQHYDTNLNEWLTTNTVSFPINGGRDGGYRGWSVKVDPDTGRWRVNVITQYGQLIGRISFTVADASTTPPLIELKR